MASLDRRTLRSTRDRLAAVASGLTGSAVHDFAETCVETMRQWAPAARRIRKAWDDSDVAARLDALALLEASGARGPAEIGQSLELALRDPAARRELSQAAALALEHWPDSPILLYLRILGLFDEDGLAEAHQLLSDALMRLCGEIRRGEATTAAMRRRAKAFSGLWKIADAVARDQTAWIVDQPPHGIAYRDFDFVRTFESLQGGKADYRTTLAFAEPLLQGRHNALYLERCRIAYGQAATLFQKLRVMRAMIRHGFRRIPDDTAAYEQARACFAEIRPELEALIRSSRSGGDPRATARLLRSAFSFAALAGLTEDARRLREAMIALVRGRAGRSAVWIVANALSCDPDSHALVMQIVGDTMPDRDEDLRDFFEYAARMGAHDKADEVFGRLSQHGRAKPSSLAYADVLQRSGRFAEAADLVAAVHARMLADPANLDHFAAHGLIWRAGELRFAAETARYYTSISQPEIPVGVILVTSRSIEELSQTPIAVLMEWKKMGWAVVPLCEGILPTERTGIEAIDRFAGCIRLGNEPRSGAHDWMKPIEPFDVDIEAGRLQWHGIDLSHILWEAAAIDRRLYSPHWSCPALRRELANMVESAGKLATVLDTARETFGWMNLRAGSLVVSSFRLPDAIVRAYCERHGDPLDFFCIHATAGDEDDFVNFQKNISSCLAIVNMTAHPQARAASMPLAAEVIATSDQHDASVEHALRQIVETARSRTGRPKPAPGAEAVLQRVARWKAGGGNVACAFGQIVCNSGVPVAGGPGHASMKDWINHTIGSVAGSRTLLLVKPHPHEHREEIACFPNETFRDLLPAHLPENVVFLGHDWLETRDLRGIADLALVYDGKDAIETALLEIPTVLAAHGAPIDYPLGHAVPVDRDDYRRMVRFEREVRPSPEGAMRAAAWLHLRRSQAVCVPYRYHSRPTSTRMAGSPVWYAEDIDAYLAKGDENVRLLAQRGVATRSVAD